MTAHYFQCPHCWEDISMVLDDSVSNQKYIEDCEVCCNPLELTVSFEVGELAHFSASSLEQ